MAILQTDILLRTMLEAGINDLRKNPWILDDVFGGLAGDPLSKVEYGFKEVKAAKAWFMGNNISVYLPYRIDNPVMPCVSILQESVSEMKDRASLSDEGMVEDIEPRSATTQPQSVVNPFTPAGYDSEKGIITMPEELDTDQMAPGQFLVSARSGKAYAVKELLGLRDFSIAPGIVDDFEGCYVVPPTSLWNLHRELAFMAEQYDIGVHASSDPVQAMWLRAVVMYIMLRYREAYLEARGFEISNINAGPIALNPNFGKDRVYSSSIKLEGQVEGSWVKFIAPKLAAVRGEVVIADGPKTPPAYIEQAKNQGWKMEGDLEKKEKKKRKRNTSGINNPREVKEDVRAGMLDIGLLGEDDTDGE